MNLRCFELHCVPPRGKLKPTFVHSLLKRHSEEQEQDPGWTVKEVNQITQGECYCRSSNLLNNSLTADKIPVIVKTLSFFFFY
jgi:hypothetical protein